MQKLRVLYFGTPDFSAEFLNKILENKEIPIKIDEVVTQEDKKVGRNQIIAQSPVKILAIKKSIKVLHDFPNEKYDLGLVFSYGKIIPKKILDLFKYGVWVVHPSILPKYKGPSPVAQALIDGEKETGVSLIIADEGVDTGDIISIKKLHINPSEKRNELTNRLVSIAYDLFIESINKFIQNNNNVVGIKQEKGDFPITKKFDKQDGFIPFEELNKAQSDNAIRIYNIFRGLYPWPGVWTKVKINRVERRLKITDMELVSGRLIIKRVQLEGKKEVDFKTFNIAYKIFI